MFNLAQLLKHDVRDCLNGVKRINFVGISWWGANWKIDMIDRRIEDFRIEDIKNTPENNVALKVRKGLKY